MIVTGIYSGEAIFTNDIKLTSVGDSDIFVAKINSSGQWQW